jgi:hypothetical protein
MIRIAREQPEDPIQFLSDFLRAAGEKLEHDATEAAKEKFYDIISEAEAANNGRFSPSSQSGKHHAHDLC